MRSDQNRGRAMIARNRGMKLLENVQINTQNNKKIQRWRLPQWSSSSDLINLLHGRGGGVLRSHVVGDHDVRGLCVVDVESKADHTVDPFGE